MLARLAHPANKGRVLKLIDARLAELARQENEADFLARQRVEQEQRQKAEADLEGTRERCKTLAGFVREAWPLLEPVTPYVHGRHIDAICDHLEAVTAGRINRLLINVPPGSSKSLLVSVLWQAWEWGPMGLASHRFLTTAFNDGPVKRDTRKTRDLIASGWFQALWPDVKLTRTAEMSFANSSTGTREGVAFGSLTSQRGDRLIIDDPHSTETAESEAERTRTTRKFREGALNRLNDQERSAIVVVMQRLNERDVSGVILELGLGFVHLMLPMEFEPDRKCVTPIGFADWRTEPGELLDPARFPPRVVDSLKVGMGAYAYAGQYQQRPAPRTGGFFAVDNIKPIAALPAGVRKTVRGWDFAASVPKPGADPDYTASVRMSRDDAGFIYIEHVSRFQKSSGEVKAAFLRTASEDTDRVSIRYPQDPGQAGKAQAEDLSRALAGYRFKYLPPTGAKTVRATPLANQIEAGNVFMLAGDWNRDFLDEMQAFPSGAHDDQVDAAADAFNELAGVQSGEGIFEYMRQEAARVHAASAPVVVEEAERVGMIPPPGISTAAGITGKLYAKGADGVIWFDPDDVGPYRGLYGWRPA